MKGRPEIEKSIFEASTREQMAAKPPIEGACDYFLGKKALAEGIANLIRYLRDKKMNPAWISKNAYKCKYKGETVAVLYVKKFDEVTIGVNLAEWDDLERVLNSMPEDLQNEFISKNATHCRVCKARDCRFGVGFRLLGETRHTCSRFNYMRVNPTAEQFEMIKRLIDVRRKYLEGGI